MLINHFEDAIYYKEQLYFQIKCNGDGEFKNIYTGYNSVTFYFSSKIYS